MAKQFCGTQSHRQNAPADTNECSSTIIERVKKFTSGEAMQGRVHQVAYFYFSFDDASSQDLNTLLRSFIAQLCPTEGILPELRSFFVQHHPARASTKDLRAILLSILRRFGDKPDNPNLLDSVTNVESTSETYFILDGLDEIPYGRSRNHVLELLEEISKLSTAKHIYVLVASRVERDISDGLSFSRGWQRYRIDRSCVENDIALYIPCQIEAHQKLSTLPEGIKIRIKSSLIQGSVGM